MNGKDDTNSGILFNNSDDWKIIQQGKLNIDGEDHRIIGVKRLNKEGKPIIELYRAIGTLKANDDKQSEKSPDAKGVVNKITDLGAMTISAWREKSEKGHAYTSLKLREFSNEYNQDTQQQNVQTTTNNTDEELDDDIPF